VKLKKLLVTLLFVTGIFTIGLFAKINFTVVGGLNRGFIEYNDDYRNDANRIAMKTGVTLGIETTIEHFIIGAAFIQQGTSYKAGALDHIGSYTFNYLSGYILGKLKYQKVLSGFSGFQLGKGLNGTQEGEVDNSLGSGDFKAEDFNLDFGLILGADIMFSSHIGFRASYYIGLIDILNEVLSNYNIKQRSVGICLIYKI